MMIAGPVEAEIQAVIDRALPPRVARAVAQRLAADPQAAARVAAGRRQAELLRATFGPIAAEPIPDAVRFAEGASPRADAGLLTVAALAVTFLLGAAAAWSVHLVLPWL